MKDACRGREEDTYTKGEDLYVRVLVVEAAFERTHGVLCGGRLRADLVAYFKIECYILSASWDELGSRFV